LKKIFFFYEKVVDKEKMLCIKGVYSSFEKGKLIERLGRKTTRLMVNDASRVAKGID